MGPGEHNLSDLELALMGYVSSSPNKIEIEGKMQPAASYDLLKNLIFEYLKINKRNFEIKDIINRSIGMLERFVEGLQGPAVDRAKRLTRTYRSLTKKEAHLIVYGNFNPAELSRVGENNPFNRYFKNKVKRLVKSGMLVNKRHGRNWYMVLRPDLKVA